MKPDEDNQSYLYSTDEFEKVLSLMNERMDLIYKEVKDVSDSSDVDSVHNCLERVFEWWFKTVKKYSKVTYQWDEITKDAFKILLKFVNSKWNRDLLQQISEDFYPTYPLEIIDKYYRLSNKNQTKWDEIKNDKLEISKFKFTDFVLTIITTFMLSQSLSNRD